MLDLNAHDRLDLVKYRETPQERSREASLMKMVPSGLATVMDVGARDGHYARLLASRVPEVIALDLERPAFSHAGVTCVAGDATKLAYADESFDLVFCAEVLEHIPEPGLQRAASEIVRVSRQFALIGVPYKQDIRIGRCTCQRCGVISPPWGHVNSFDERRLGSLFVGMQITAVDYVGEPDLGTNSVACKLMDWAGNPYGSYSQEERCPNCGSELTRPPPRTTLQRVLARAAVIARSCEKLRVRPRGNWIHLLLEKQTHRRLDSHDTNPAARVAGEGWCRSRQAKPQPPTIHSR